MKKEYSTILEKKDNIFYCSIPELKLVTKGEDLAFVFAELETLKIERLKSLNDYDDFSKTSVVACKSNDAGIKKFIIVLFFCILSVGILTRMVGGFLGNLAQKTENLMVTKTLRVLKPATVMSPEEKAEKLKRFEEKIVNAQKMLKEAKPFIEASKPLLRDIQESFDLKKGQGH